jgi:peptidoglycan hydrolase-like protein with peptidoglycan-binding domain
LYVVAEDGICDDVESDNKLSFDVNEPFTITLESSDDNSDSYCIGQDGLKEIKLTAIVSPEEAAKHIKAYVWNRLAKPIVSDTTSTNELVLHDEWLSPGVKNKFEVLAFDGICSSADSKVEAGKEISINRYDDARLSLDLSYYTQNKDTVCSIKDLIIIDTTIVRSDDMTGTINYESNFYYSKNPARVTRDYDVLSSNNVFTDNLNLSNYIPGDSLYFKVSIDDGICNAITKEIGTVVLTPFTASINVSKDPICENENVKFELANFKPEQSANYVKYYSWYQSSAETDGNFVPLSDFDNRAYETNQLKAGNYKVLSFISDGICYGVQMFGDPQGSVYSYETPQVELKVNAPIKVELIPSADAYCEGETPNPITFAAKVTQGEPSKYVWYNSENKVVKEILSTSTEDYFTIEPTVSDNAFKVEVYDGVCNTIGTAAENSFSVAVYQPFVLDVASSAYDICLGDSVNLGLGVLQGTARNITWSGDKVIPNKDNNIYSFAYPQLPGEAFYSVTASNGVCEDETVHVGPIIVHEPITVELTSNVSNVTIGAKIDLTANVLSGKPLEFEWMDGDVSIGKTNDVKLEKYMPKSTSVFSLYATDGVCPVAFAQLELGVVLPTAFTPHTKDGLNDVYMEGYEVIIFDRYGQKVFEGANGWDGTHRGVMADPGVYFSQVKLKNDKIVSGTIEIVKYD